MKEVLLNQKQIEEEIAYEDSCKSNDLLQQLLIFKDSVNVYHMINDNGEVCDWVIRDKETGKDMHL